MNNKFDELTKNLAQSVTRRAALKTFGVGLAGMALACFGLANKGEAGNKDCMPSGTYCADAYSSPRTIQHFCHKCCNGYTCTFVSCYCL